MEGLRDISLALTEIRDPLLPLWVMELLADVFFYTWLFALGATVGSFLNVVVYRLPRGKNLALPGSRCPRCGTAIQLSDNIPIVSWLALRGRCRHCQGSISPRYFVVELLVAVTFLLVLLGDYYLPPGALAAPVRPPLTTSDGIPFWVMVGIHTSLVTTIIGAVLIASDGFRVPARLFAPIVLAALVAPLLWPQIRSIPALSYGQISAWQAGFIDCVAGLAAGAIIGIAFDLVARRLGKSASSLAPIALTASLGIVLGWQRVLWLAPLVLLAAEWIVQGLRAMAPRYEAVPADAPQEAPSAALPPEATPPPTPETIQEEVHIASAPTTEPTETS
jgi:leader peptidase (prepilin peptidase) / N-methyltransferase